MNCGMLLMQQFGPFVRGVVPPWLVEAFVLLTELGNVGLFLALFVVDYWFVDHERGAHAIGLIIAGMATVVALKFFFAVPRPPESVNAIPISGHSFPSGHAMGATIAYGTLAYDLEVGSRRLRYAAASAIVAFVALSRVVLGVHFFRDVVAGVFFGVAFLAAAFALTGRDPRRGFLLAVALGVVALAVSGGSDDGVAVTGAALGAAVTWESLDAVPSVELRRTRVLLVGFVLPLLAGIGILGARGGYPPVVIFLLNAILLTGLLAAPVVEGPFERTVDTGEPEGH